MCDVTIAAVVLLVHALKKCIFVMFNNTFDQLVVFGSACTDIVRTNTMRLPEGQLLEWWKQISGDAARLYEKNYVAFSALNQLLVYWRESCHETAEVAGGSGLRVAVGAASALRSHHNPLPVVFYGLVGDDDAAKIIRAKMAEFSVTDHAETTRLISTARSLVVNVAEGFEKRTITFVYQGANEMLETIQLAKHQTITAKTLFYVNTSQPAATIVRAIEIAKAKGAFVVLGCSKPEKLAPYMADLLPKVDGLIMNSDELTRLANIMNIPMDDWRHATAQLARTQGQRFVIVTHGKFGLSAHDPHNTHNPYHAEPAMTVPHVVSSIGAGDRAAGEFLAALAEGKDFVAALRAMVRGGAKQCLLHGELAPLPRDEDVWGSGQDTPPMAGGQGSAWHRPVRTLS